MKKLLLVVGILALAGAIAWGLSIANRDNPSLVVPSDGSAQPAVSLAEGLVVPWDMAFLPTGDILVTERPGRVRLVDANSGLRETPVLELPQVAAVGEAGLLGMALHPDFTDVSYVYLYYTHEGATGLVNRVSRFPLDGATFGTEEVILDGIPGGRIHDGGRIRFGPDGLLYVTAGDSGSSDLAQDPESLAGKILRIRPDGGLPGDNPFPDSPVYSYGHRNPEGLVWDEGGRLWETEHGSSATDEVNLIHPGSNYGWPLVRGDAVAAGMEPPFLQSGSDTWAPSGMAWLDGSLYFAGLRGASLYEVPLQQEPTLVRHLHGDYGRLRNVTVGIDGNLYILTSNRDGRGTFVPADDRLVRIDPGAL
jgi:glucose/arabinose dehydrogenase